MQALPNRSQRYENFFVLHSRARNILRCRANYVDFSLCFLEIILFLRSYAYNMLFP